MEWLDFSNTGMIIMGVVAGLAAIGFMIFMGRSLE